MAPDELPWEGVYWPLVGVALNTMIQPCGRVCGSDPNLHVYARSSPVVCAFDSIAILVRFLLHLIKSRSPIVAAKWTLEDRNADEDADPQESFRAPLLLKLIIFVVGPVYCFGKLVMAHNIGWTQVWAWCYIVSYFAIWTLRVLKIFAKEEETLRRPQWQRYPRKAVDEGLGYVALVLQILIFAWVDLAAISPDTDLLLRYTYQFFRLGGLGVAIGIHYMFAKVHLRGVNPAPDAMKALSSFYPFSLLVFYLLRPYWYLAINLG
ncbi:hypothetical protein GQ53DRAFT_765828 [Thozetella sp. PMI_491]|nr:hypothetical protein GQ53DRAFT_765828 [Thozetella sp. PMI_491]